MTSKWFRCLVAGVKGLRRARRAIDCCAVAVKRGMVRCVVSALIVGARQCGRSPMLVHESVLPGYTTHSSRAAATTIRANDISAGAEGPLPEPGGCHASPPTTPPASSGSPSTEPATGPGSTPRPRTCSTSAATASSSAAARRTSAPTTTSRTSPPPTPTTSCSVPAALLVGLVYEPTGTAVVGRSSAGLGQSG
jgi:hypothetical protein